MKGKTLVAYATKGGATQEIANAIAETLRSRKMSVDVVDLCREKKPDFSVYDNIVAGAGVRMGKIYGEFLSFVSNDFGERKIALFIVCGEAGGNAKCESVADKHMQAIKSVNPGMKPVEFSVFGGRTKILWKVVNDSVDVVKVKQWAEKIGKKFASVK